MSVTAISIPPRLSSLAKVRRKCLGCKRESTPSWGLFAPVHRQAPHTSRDRTGTELSCLQLSSQQYVCVCVSGEEWVGGCKRRHPATFTKFEQQCRFHNILCKS
ncbi:hypothetical protein CRENBAI_012065 [Crenichthys baileyi]|uniref:Uncharacterized protein n=1 Tax=Crenichthys baileyi TaxID=28760 RepID=A0AAV9RMA3_9TELE